MFYSNGKQFATYDLENDEFHSCAKIYGGGFWFPFTESGDGCGNTRIMISVGAFAYAPVSTAPVITLNALEVGLFC